MIDHKIIIAYQNEIINSPTLSDKEKIEMIRRANNAAVAVSNAETEAAQRKPENE